MTTSNTSLGIVILTLMLTGASCTLKGSSDTVIQSSNKGNTWQSKSLVKGTGGKLLRLTTAEATFLAVNPKNSLNLFLGTKAQGLFISDNAAIHWTQMIANQEIVDVVLDPTAKCTLFVALPTKVLRTVNCAESWETIYNETRKTRITSIALDSSDPMVVYIASLSGDVFKSTNQGMTWNSVFYRDRTPIAKILLDQFDTAIVTIISRDSQVIRSYTKGGDWQDITPPKEIQLQRGDYRAAQVSGKKEQLFLATSMGLWKFEGTEKSWRFIPPLTPIGSVDVRVGAMNPSNEDEIYYATKNTFYHSTDNGAHWTAQVLPTSQWPSVIAIDPNNLSIIYMGLMKEVEKNPYL
ncbi:MAG: hypothetical protein AAB400_03320 [Patescibacteria group bacterium]